ncbi:MAG TPA: SPOR domain-containing protein [Puia sp.]|nr:SPOR domain-containing protein [Puia sp.]
MKKITIVWLVCCIQAAKSQSNSVIVEKDPLLDSLIAKQIQINEATTRESRRNVPGYRILVITSPDRAKIFAAKAQIYQQYPELQPYILYQIPNYKLKIGNFKTQADAQQYMDKMAKLYPSGVYIIHDIIEVKPD